jgi:hypothetical protein
VVAVLVAVVLVVAVLVAVVLVVAGWGWVVVGVWSLSRFIIFMGRIGLGCRRWFRIFVSCGGGGVLLLS